MKIYTNILLLLLLSTIVDAQLYFPPISSNEWKTMDISELGWCESKIDSLYDFLEQSQTKAFILLKDGRIVMEKYFGDHTQNSAWYWASAGKVITAFMTGIAQQDGFVSITDSTSRYLGKGWTNATPEQEWKITVWHQLTMTTGLDSKVNDPFCTLDTCLNFLVEPGSRWDYHNAPYTLLDGVIESATGMSLNQYTSLRLKNPTGMTGGFIRVGYNNVYFSNARSMARFGLLILNRGDWSGQQIMTDTSYFREMVNTSQELNKAYGYLWWLNGKTSFMLPQVRLTLPGKLIPNAPDDLILAAGKNGQFLNVVPSENMVWLRMGDTTDPSFVPMLLNDQIWDHINDLKCTSVSVLDSPKPEIIVYPNPVSEFISIKLPESVNLRNCRVRIFNLQGTLLLETVPDQHNAKLDIENFTDAVYLMKVIYDNTTQTGKIIKSTQ